MRYPAALKEPWAFTVIDPSSLWMFVHKKVPPIWFARAGVIVTKHSPALDWKTTRPSGPWTENCRSRSGAVGC